MICAVLEEETKTQGFTVMPWSNSTFQDSKTGLFKVHKTTSQCQSRENLVWKVQCNPRQLK